MISTSRTSDFQISGSVISSHKDIQSKRKIGLDVIEQQIAEVQEEVIRAKRKYDETTDRLKSLLDKKKELQTEELMSAVMKISHSYEDILRYIKSNASEEEGVKKYYLHHCENSEAVFRSISFWKLTIKEVK